MMARARLFKTIFKKIEPRKAECEERDECARMRLLENIVRQRHEAEQLFVMPFSEIEDYFMPKPIAYRYEVDPEAQLHYIPELNRLK